MDIRRYCLARGRKTEVNRENARDRDSESIIVTGEAVRRFGAR